MLLLDGFIRRPPPELAVLPITQIRAETGAGVAGVTSSYDLP